MEFGQRLKNLRLSQKRTQQDLASCIGVSVVAVRSWEHGSKKPSMDALVSLSKSLGVSVDSLLGITGCFQPIGVILSPTEKTLLNNYQMLDSYGKKAVETMCALEKERVDALQKVRESNVVDFKQP